MRHEKWLSFPEWRMYVSKLLYFSLSARESLVKQLLASMLTLTKDTLNLALMGESWDVFCEDLEEHWLHYSLTTLYVQR